MSADEYSVQMHEVLLSLAGRVPDEFVALARQELADGAITQVAEAVCQELARQAVTLGIRQADLLSRLVDHSAAETFGRIRIRDEQSVLAWRFTGEAPSPTVEPRPSVEARPFEHSAAVDALIAVLSDTTGARGLWRAWRIPIRGQGPPLPVYVVEADTADPAGLTGRLQRALTTVDSDVPRVEVVAPGAEVPMYQRAARSYGPLVWTATEPAQVRLARAFDGVDDAGEPFFTEDHPRLLDAAERERVLDYLRAATVVLHTDATMEDVVDPARGAVVPTAFRSDGSWIWPDIVSYFLDEHGLAPDERLLAHVRNADGPPAPLDAVTTHHVLEHLFNAQD